MICDNCDDYDVLFRSVARSKAWVESSVTFLQTEQARRRPRTFTQTRSGTRRYERIFSSYFLELFTLTRDPLEAIERLYENLAKESRLPEDVVAEILEVKSQRDISRRAYPVIKEEERKGLFSKLGYLRLYNPLQISLTTCLRYELFRTSWNLDWSLCPGTPFAAIPTELGHGNYYSLYQDEETRGVLENAGSKLYSTLLSGSKAYNDNLMETIRQLLKKNKAAEFLLLSDLPVDVVPPEGFWKSQIKYKKDGFIYVVGNGDQGQLLKKFQERIPPVPAIPIEFDSMYANLKELADHPPIEWAKSYRNHEGNTVIMPTLKLGLVTRVFERDYFATDSISDVFSYKERIKCHVTNRKTGEPMMTQAQYWAENRFFTRRLLEENDITREDLPDFIYDRTKTCGLFDAALAVYIYKKYGGKGSRVLDGFAGWGDRLIAASVVGCEVYDGFDTTPTIPYSDMINKLNKNYQVKVQPFETAVLEKGYYDICLSSPPFWRYELYTGETTSTTLFDKLEDWVDGFWKPCLEVMLEAVRSGGYIALYIPSGNDEVGIKMRDAVEDVFGRFTRDLGTLGFGHISGDNQVKIRQTYIYRKN
jgi:hypothetical protein